MRAIAVGLVIVVMFSVAGAAEPDIEMFTRAGCPYCAAALDYLERLGRERPDFRIEDHIAVDPAAFRHAA